jgi:DNA-binding MarR family transcriptional regulator
MTTLVKVLERDGFVERRGDPSDGRVAIVAVSEAGAAFVRERRRSNAEAFTQLIDKLSDEDAATLAAAIPALQHLRALSEGLPNSSGSPTGSA